jgi:WD40 repeat protein
MYRTATLALLVALILSSPAAPAGSPDRSMLVAFSADDGRLAVASERGGIRVLSVPDLKEIRLFALQQGRRLGSAAFSPNGRWIAANDNAGDLMIWNVETGEAQPALPIKHSPDAGYVFDPVAETLLVNDKSLQIWDLKQAREAGVIEGMTHVGLMTLSPDGRYLFAFAQCRLGRIWGDVCVYDIEEKKVVAAAEWKALFGDSTQSWYATDIVYTDDGRILLTIAKTGNSWPYPPEYQSRFLDPGDLRVMDSTTVSAEREWQYPGLRSAGRQTEVITMDRKWKATAYQNRLYLYRITEGGGRALEKYIPIP